MPNEEYKKIICAITKDTNTPIKNEQKNQIEYLMIHATVIFHFLFCHNQRKLKKNKILHSK